MRRYLVMRQEGLHYGRMNDTLNSSYFPVLVEFTESLEPSTEEIVKEAFRQRGWDTYKGLNKSYIVFRIYGGNVISFTPKRDYDVKVEPFYG